VKPWVHSYGIGVLGIGFGKEGSFVAQFNVGICAFGAFYRTSCS